MRTFPFFETLGADIRFATRSLMKNPAFLVVVVLSLALGIAANSTIFSVLDTLLYRPLPYPHPERLVVVWETESARPDRTIPPPIAELVDWQKQNHVFEDIALISFNDTASVSGLGEPCSACWGRNQFWGEFFFPRKRKIVPRLSSSAPSSGSTSSTVIRGFWGEPSLSRVWSRP